MIFYVDLQPKDSANCKFRNVVYKFVSDLGYSVIGASKPYLKIDTVNKTAIDVSTTEKPPAVNERTSWKYFNELLKQ